MQSANESARRLGARCIQVGQCQCRLDKSVRLDCVALRLHSVCWPADEPAETIQINHSNRIESNRSEASQIESNRIELRRSKTTSQVFAQLAVRAQRRRNTHSELRVGRLSRHRSQQQQQQLVEISSESARAGPTADRVQHVRQAESIIHERSLSGRLHFNQ